jgi:hypothetical protein
VQVFDASLEGDGEVSQVSLCAAQQHALRRAQTAHVAYYEHEQHERDNRDGDRSDGDPTGDVRREAHSSRLPLTQRENNGVFR